MPSATTKGLGIAAHGVSIQVFGTEQLIKRLQDKRKRVSRMRYVGVRRAGKFLYDAKKELCKQGLYSGQEVAPNRWRYGWAYLGGPAKYHFTRNLLNAHRLGKVVIGNIDRVEVWIDMAQAPYAGKIHGPIDAESTFWSTNLREYVRTRPWMRVSIDETRESREILEQTYRGH